MRTPASWSALALLTLLLSPACAPEPDVGRGTAAQRGGDDGRDNPFGGPIRRPRPTGDDDPKGGEPIPQGEPDLPVGRLEARFDVNSTGAATYTLPIEVPPGVRGIEPKLSATYNSQAGDSVLGIGFGLAGLPKIERCSRTQALDGRVGGVDGSEDDRFCINGMRLLVTEADDRGRPLAYMTEGQTWSRFEADGLCTTLTQVEANSREHDGNPMNNTGMVAGFSGPCSFSATLKNGNVARFGGHEETNGCNVLVSNNGGEPRLDWPLTQLTDTYGNTMRVVYQDIGHAYCAPVAVHYTGNDGEGVLYRRKVEFRYTEGESAPLWHRYVGGIKVWRSQMLQSIETFVRAPNDFDWDLVKRYEFTPRNLDFNKQRVVASVEECAGGLCYPPTEVEWTDISDPPTGPSSIFTMDEYNHGTNASFGSRVPILGRTDTVSGDFNCDGMQDLAYPEAGDQRLSTPNSDNLLVNTPWNPAIARPEIPQDEGPPLVVTYGQRFHVGDFDGDGCSDLLHLQTYALDGRDGYAIYFGDRQGLADVPVALGSAPSLRDQVTLGDVSGDGRTDLVAMDNPQHPGANGWANYFDYRLYVWTGGTLGLSSQGTLPDAPSAWPVNPGPTRYFHPRYTPGDFDGDGRIDFLVRFPLLSQLHTNADFEGHSRVQILWSRGTSLTPGWSDVWPHPFYQVVPADVNGDGLTDVVLTGSARDDQIAPHDTADTKLQEGYLVLHANGVSLAPVLTHQATHVIHLHGQVSTQKTWGFTGGDFDWRHLVVPANFNSDGRADVMTAFHNRWAVSAVQGIDALVSDGDAFHHRDTVPRDPLEPWAPIRLGESQHTGVFKQWVPHSGSPMYYFWRQPTKTGLISTITDGLDGRIELAYRAMTALNEVYELGTGAVYPEREFIAPLHVVRQVRQNDGQDDLHDSWYHYKRAHSHLHGYGFLGFEEIEVSKPNGRTLETKYRLDHPYTGFVDRQRELAQGILLTQVDLTYTDVVHPTIQVPHLHNVLLASQRMREYVLSGPSGAYVESLRAFAYDDFGNPIQVDDRPDTANGASRVVTDTTYHNDLVHWRIGFPVETTVHTGVAANYLEKRRVDYDKPLRMGPVFEGKLDAPQGQWLGTEYRRNALGLVSAAITALGTTEYTYDDFGHLSTTTNALGHVESKEVDPRFGVEIVRWDANGHRVETELDGFGRPMRVTGPDEQGNSRLLRRFYYLRAPPKELLGMVTQTWNLRSFDGAAEWDWTESWSDVLGRVVRERRRGSGGRAIVEDRAYTAMEYVDRQSLPYFTGETPQWLEYTYDLKGRVIRTDLPDGRAFTNTYQGYHSTEKAMVMTRTAPDLSTTTLYVDFREKLVRKVDALGVSTRYGYDGMGRLTATNSPEAQTLTAYDELGRKVSVTDTDTGTTLFEYDAAGQLVAEVDAKNNRVERTYDALGRTASKRFFPSGASNPSRSIEYVHDDTSMANGRGRLTHVYGPGYAYDLAYDAYGRQRSATLRVDGRTFNWGTRFDPMGVATERTYPDGSIARYGYDGGKFLSEVSLWEPGDPAGVFTPYATYAGHDASGRVGHARFDNDVASCWTRDPANGRLSRYEITAYSGKSKAPCAVDADAKLVSNKYAWDTVDNLTGITDEIGADSQTFGYDARGALTSAQGLYGSRAYAYTPGGNFASITRGATTLSYQYALGGHRATSRSDGLQVSYDANGNVTHKVRGADSWTLAWDEEDLLTSVTHDGQTTAFLYDQDGHRLRKAEQGGSTTYYVGSDYEVTVPAQGPERHTKYLQGPHGRMAQITRTGVVLVHNASERHERIAAMNDPTTLGGAAGYLGHRVRAVAAHPATARAASWSLVVLPGLGLLALLLFGRRREDGAPRPLRRPALAAATVFAFFATHASGAAEAAMSAGAHGPGEPQVGVRYLHQDHLTSTLLVTDPVGAVSARVRYAPYGEVHASSAGVDDFRPKYGGHELDRTTDLVFMQARYYDPDLARFVSADHGLGTEVTEAIPHNRYAYAGNSPVTRTDPTGRAAVVTGLIVAAVVGLVAGALIAGTEGKILTDPSNAFDDFDTGRAAIGGAVGFAAGLLSFGAGALASAAIGPTILGVSTQTVVTTAMYQAVIATTVSYASGERHAGKLAGTFFATLGLSLASIALSSKDNQVAKVTNEVFGGAANSLVKAALNPDEGVKLDLWIFHVSLDRRTKVSLNFGYAFSTTIGMLGALQSGGLEKGGMKLKEMMRQVMNPEQKSLSDAYGLWQKAKHDGSASVYGLYTQLATGLAKVMSENMVPEQFGLGDRLESPETMKKLKDALDALPEDLKLKEEAALEGLF